MKHTDHDFVGDQEALRQINPSTFQQKTVEERALHWQREAAEIVVATYLNDASLMVPW